MPDYSRTRRSRLMSSIEKRYGRPLEVLLPEKYNELGLPRMAEEMGVNKGTL